MLAPFWFEIREAKNGREAIDIWQDWSPNLIWMDLRMPVMDGYKAVKAIREIEKEVPESPKTVIIALTAGTFQEERAVVLNAGCDDFLRKPFKESDIFDLMHKHIGVRFIYLVPPPRHELEALYELTMFGDLRKVRERMKYPEEIDQKYGPFARKVSEFAEHYEDEPILALLQQHMEIDAR